MTEPVTAAPSRFAWPSRRIWIDIAVLTTLAILGLLGFAVSFSGSLYLLAGIGGLVVGTAVGVVAARFRLGPLLTGLIGIAAYFLFGSALAMPAFATLRVFPSATTLSGLAIGAVFGWRDIVTLNTPVAAPDYIAVLPYVAAWAVGLISATVATRWFAAHRRTPLSSLLALLASSALYVAGVLTGTDSPFAPLRGVAFAIIAIVWMAWRVPEASNSNLGSSSDLIRRKLIGAGSIVAVAVIGGSLLGAAIQPGDRFVLRKTITPPFDLTQYASPLAGFRFYAKSTSPLPLFTVTGLKEGDYLRVATMDSYNGEVWNVTSDSGRSDSGTFDVVQGDMGKLPVGASKSTETLHITIGSYTDYWMPTSGYATSVAFTAKAPSSTDVRYNNQSGILLDTAQLHKGQKYTVTVHPYVRPSNPVLSRAASTSDVPVLYPNLPPSVKATADMFAGGDTASGHSPAYKLTQIETQLSNNGILSHGEDGAPPSLAGHSAERMAALLKDNTQMVGDDEQFASAFALMAESLGYPARVVLGFKPQVASDGTATVMPKDVVAWDEVELKDVGWVEFHPEPKSNKTPTVTPSKPKTDSLPPVRTPPHTDNNQNDPQPPTQVSQAKKKPDVFVLPDWVVPTAVAISIPLAAYFVPLLLVAAAKRRRRTRRRTADTPDRQAAGAWDELLDVYSELGYRVAGTPTRVQAALSFEEQFRQQLEARERERTNAARRAANRAERAAAKAEAKANAAGTAPRGTSVLVGDAMSGAVARLRDASTWRPGVAGENDALPVIPGLREFAVESDAAVFSGADIPSTTVDTLWSDLDTAQDAARRSVSWFRRRLSAFRMRSSGEFAKAVAARVAAASVATRKLATRNPIARKAATP